MFSRMFFGPGMLVMALAILAAGCGKNTTNDLKTISSDLSGKWEVNRVVLNGTELSLPYSGIDTGGYLFSTNSLTSYINGNVSFETRGVYTEGGKFFISKGQAGYFYIITGNELNILIDGSSGIFAIKVSGFSWE